MCIVWIRAITKNGYGSDEKNAGRERDTETLPDTDNTPADSFDPNHSSDDQSAKTADSQKETIAERANRALKFPGQIQYFVTQIP